MATGDQQRDLVLPPLTFAQVLDRSKGQINTVVGPTKIPMSDQERAVRFNPQTRKFDETDLTQAVQPFVYAQEGSYIVLENPADGKNEKLEHPSPGNSNNVPELQYGKKLNIKGPVNFPLWPGQIAEVIQGHTLRSNQYLLCRVYNPEEAQANWGQGIIATKETGDGENPSGSNISDINQGKFTTGQLIIIKGSEVSFYVPPTGIEVLPDTRTTKGGETGKFVREANTLEALEYCILVNEQGEKRYERGPKVVFPDPTETFLTRMNAENEPTRRFRALNLTKLQGIYVQVISDYNDDGSPTAGKSPDHKTGEELFITGEEMPIYYPRTEHAILMYGNQERHNSVAIPKGEGRYVLNRMTGDIALIRGPKMLLANPIHEVIVSRILSDKQVTLWFPNNTEALNFNRELAENAEDADVASPSYVSQGSIRSRKSPVGGQSLTASAVPGNIRGLAAASLESYDAPAAASAMFGNKLQRGQTYTPPRTLTLDTKYDGVVNISPYTNYAVQVVSKTGERKVIVGPATHLLEYDETLDVITFSKGTPKNHDQTMQTVYLQTTNNRVTDQIIVETLDMVKVTLTISSRVNFEGDPSKWFAVENYVKMLCQHIKSRMASAVKKITIANFYDSAIDITRSTILGEKDVTTKERPGLRFPENGMRIYDVEVTQVSINDATVSRMLQTQMVSAFTETLDLANLKRNIAFVKESEALKQQITAAQHETKVFAADLAVKGAVAEFQLSLQRRQNEIEEQGRMLALEKTKQDIMNLSNMEGIERGKQQIEAELAAMADRQKIEVEYMEAETTALSARLQGIQGPLGEVLLALSSNDTMQKLADAANPMNMLGGDSIAEVIQKCFAGTSMAEAMASMVQKGNPTRRSTLVGGKQE